MKNTISQVSLKDPSKIPAGGNVGLMPRSSFVTMKDCTEMVFRGKCKALAIHTGTNCSAWVVNSEKGFRAAGTVVSKVTQEEVSKRISYGVKAAGP